uniref:Unspecific monooxygenase n=1 Tax=Meloidogyne hapla TaxID=6305 RepID=A0A1I8BIY7_MELHA
MSWWPHLIRHLPYFKEIFLEVQRKIMRTYAFFKKQIEEHENDGEYLGDERLDFVSAFMREIKLRNGKEDYDMETLYAHLLDFWIAGQETTTDTLNWGIIHIIHNINIQEKLHKELDLIIGSDRQITLADKTDLPYSNAVVNEIMRIANVLPQNLARRTVQDVKVRGHLLRKGTSIQPLISCVLYDENIFPNSRQFLPERFLNENGTLKRFDEFIPFSIGKRFCAGESLARTELFLIFVNLFNQYEISPPKYSEMPSKQQNFGLSVVPLPYKCQIRKRFIFQRKE